MSLDSFVTISPRPLTLGVNRCGTNSAALDWNSQKYADPSWLVEQERDSEHDEKESEIHKREAPSTTPVEAISELELSLLFQRRHSQINQDRGAHHQETEVQEPVYQR